MCPMTPADLAIADGHPEPGATGQRKIALGERVRDLRRRRKWTLEEAANRTGLSRSSISKIEREEMSPTFDAMQKLANGFAIDLSELFGPAMTQGAAGRRSITRANAGEPYASPTCDHLVLAADLAQKRMLPFQTTIKARSIDDYPDWDRHESEDFMFVLFGTVTVHTELYEPVTLKPGDSIYMDGRMGHACVSEGNKDAVVIWVSAA